jgi:hypothetical protein
MIAEYVLLYRTRQHEKTLAWATIEPAPAGGFTVWSAPLGGWTGPHTGYYGRIDARPWWRPSEQAAREAALDLCMEWARACPYTSRALTIEECDEAWVLAEHKIPPAKKKRKSA